MKGVILTLGGPTRRICDDTGKWWTFEMHSMCGPAVLDAKGDPRANQPPQSSPFWRVVTLWTQQGKRLKEDGTCQWDEPAPLVVRQIVGKHYEVVSGDALEDLRRPGEHPTIVVL